MKLGLSSLVVLLSSFLTSVPADGQTIFSVNALGYVDIALHPGSNFVSHPFGARDHTFAALLPQMPAGTRAALWDPALQSFGPTNYFSANGWSIPDMPLRQPDGALVWMSQPGTISFSGEIFGPAAAMSRPAGYHLLGVIPSQGFFTCSDFNECVNGTPPDGTTVCLWNPDLQQCDSYWYLNIGGPGDPSTGWYDASFNQVELQLATGQAGLFFVPSPFFVPTPQPPISPGSAGIHLVRPERSGNNFSFRFNADIGSTFQVLRSTSPSDATWSFVHESVTTGTVNVVTVTDTNGASAFYRIAPPHTHPSLFNAARSPGRFSFQFHAPSNSNYRVDRRPGFSLDWQIIATLTDVQRGVASFTDSNAVARTAHYRVALEP